MTDESSLSEERARQIWRRAAELQAEAAARLEKRSRLLAPGEADTSEQFALTDVRSAALEAGISPEFVDLALAESTSPGVAVTNDAAMQRARRFLGDRRRSVEVSRVINAPPARVHEAMQRVLPSARYALLLVDTLGDNPLEDGVFVFEPPSMWTQNGAASTFASRMGGISAKRLYLSLRDVGSGRTEVSIRVPLDRALLINYRVGASLGSALGIGGGLMAFGIVTTATAGLALPVAASLAALGGLGGLAVGGGGSWGLARWGVSHGVKKAKEELATLLQVLDASTRGSFPMPGTPEPASGPLGG